MTDCVFCEITHDRVIAENSRFFAILDGFPVTEGHTLIIPKKHAETFFDLTNDDMIFLNDLITRQKDQLEKSDPSIKGFNIGINCGEIAGQTVFHCHIHLIPRRKGDVEGDPRGGIRHMIPGKGNY